ncbi:MAG: glycosyltransferase family 2 protein [Marinilabiliaceae bacterium]
MANKTAVVILNWNGKELMRRYLPAVIENSEAAGGVDVVVADNASADGSLDMLRQEFPQVTVIALDQNYGFAEGYNRALRQLPHEYVVLLNSDVAPAPGWLAPLVALLDGDASVGACGPKLLDDKAHEMFEYAGAAGGFIDRFGYPFCRGRVLDRVEKDSGQYDSDADVLWVSGAALMLRRELYCAAGGLDSDFFAHMEEIDLCWRLRNMGLRIVACCGSGAKVYHLGGATLSSANPRKAYLNFRNNLTMLVKNYNGRMWWAVVFFRLVLDGVAGAKYLLSGQGAFCAAIVRAHWSFFGTLRRSLAKRAALKAGRGRELVPEVRPYSMLWRFFALGRKTFSRMDG